METIKIPVDNKFVKRLNDMNQDAKYVYTDYYIYPDGTIVSDPRCFKLQKGIHYGRTDFKLHDSIDNMVVRLNAESIFRTIKDRKKEIINMELVGPDILLSGDSLRVMIGRLIKPTSTSIEELTRRLHHHKQYMDSFVPQIFLSDNEVIELVKNDCKTIELGEYKTRITRELIPGLKKSHDVVVSITKHSNSALFNLHLRSTRSTMETTHQYQCIKI